MSELLENRVTYSSAKISALRPALSEALSHEKFPEGKPELCIYATGSLARLEATEFSDLDVFFLLSGTASEQSLGRIRDVRILGDVVRIADALQFPDFSNDGEYLSFLHIDDIVMNLGGRLDDYHNAFTARMLMVIESTWLFNEGAFRNFKETIIRSYFRDFHGHAKDFRPTFLLNDILRFWRTLCLNYEHGRQWRGDMDAERKAKGHLSNLKLKFSRMNICFSFIAYMLSFGAPLSPDEVLAATELTPMQRIQFLKEKYPDLEPLFSTMSDEYLWFLDVTGHDKKEVLAWIAEKPNRVEAFRRADRFGGAMYEAVHAIADRNDYLRYLVV